MNEMMKKLLMSKLDQGKDLSDDESSAQLSVLKDLKGQMKGMAGDKLKGGLKKVSVMSDSPQGLQEGLDKAQEVVSEPEEMMDMEEQPSSEEEIDQKIQELLMLKEQLKSRKPEHM